MNKRDRATPLDNSTTIDMDLVVEKSVEKWLKLFKVWDGTTKLSKLDKVLRLETFFAQVFDPAHFTVYPGLEQDAIECEDGGDEDPGCRGEFHRDMACCPFCTNSVNDDPDQKTEQQIADHLIRVVGTKVPAAKKAPASPINPKVEEKPKARPLAMVEEIPAQTNAPIATVEELDASVERVVATYASATTNAYECAVEIKEIHERQLWRQRRDAEGKPKYEHFNNFVEAELTTRGITRKGAYALMSFAQKFTREQFEKLGPAKMNVLASLSDEHRSDLADETILKQLPLAEVRERKEEIRAQVSDRSDTVKKDLPSRPSPKPGGKSPKVDPTPENEQAFTMVFPSSTFSVNTIATKGQAKKVRAAKSLDDLPVAEIAGINGMKLRLSISQAKDGSIQIGGFLIRED